MGRYSICENSSIKIVNKNTNEILILMAFLCANASNKRPRKRRPIPKSYRSKFGLSFHLHPTFLYACSTGSGESALLRRLSRAFAYRDAILIEISYTDPVAYI